MKSSTFELGLTVNSHNSVLSPFWGNFPKCRYFRGGRYFQKSTVKVVQDRDRERGSEEVNKEKVAAEQMSAKAIMALEPLSETKKRSMGKIPSRDVDNEVVNPKRKRS